MITTSQRLCQSRVSEPDFALNLARLCCTLDHLCGGRFGWDIVTSGEDLAAETFGIDTRSTLRETLTEF